MPGALDGRVAWVTGAGRGIGAAAARRLAAAGAKIALCARTASEIDATASALRAAGATVHAAVCDVGRAADVAAFHEAARARLGAVDVLVNNAGVLLVRDAVETAPEDWARVVEVNLVGAFACVRAVLPEMLARGRGRIVNVSSISGTLGTPRLTAYCASKWGLIGFTKALAEEVRTRGVQVVAIAPGSVDTDMLRLGRPDLSAQMTADEVARAIVWLAAEAPDASTGTCLEMFG